MEGRLVTCYHLYHSGVAVEVGRDILIFDYYNDHAEGRERSLSAGVISREMLKEKEGIYVFVSHHHRDHYNPIIFKWMEQRSGINYILSDDIQPAVSAHPAITLLGKYQEQRVAGVMVKTFGSTDQGVSFLVEKDGLMIFHSGDLNWWKWKDFTPAQQQKEAEDYQREVEKLVGVEIDIAFVPVDPRLAQYYFLAGDYFANKIKPKLLIPLHFSNNYDITGKFSKKVKVAGVKVAEITKRGEKVIYQQHLPEGRADFAGKK